MSKWISVNVDTDVDIYVSEIIEDIDTEDLQNELNKRRESGSKGSTLPLDIGTARTLKRVEAFIAYGLITNELLDELEKKSGKVIFVG